MKLSILQAAQYARVAGFSGDNLVTILAIAMAESNLDTSAVNASSGATGILQIYLAVHPDVTRNQALDPGFSFRYAWKLSSGGKNFCPWQSYDSYVCGSAWDNRYKQFIPTVQAALGTDAGTVPPTPTLISTAATNLKKTYTLAANQDMHDFLSNVDDAVTIANPFDIDTSSMQDNVLGASFTDPVKWLNELGRNIVRDTVAIVIRLIFIILGIYILYRVIDHFLHVTEVIQSTAANIGKAALL